MYSGQISGTTSTTAPVRWDTRQIDTHGAVTTGANWKFTAPVAGIYRISCCSAVSSGTAEYAVYKNGVATTSRLMTVVSTSVNNGSSTISLNAGDYIDVRPLSGSFTSNAGTDYNIAIERLSGPSAIAASETITMSAYLNANANVNADAIIIWNTKEFDSHSAYSTTSGQFVAPISGTYEVSTYVYGSNPGASVGYFIWKNNTKTKVITWQPSGSNTAGYALIKLNAGDTVDIRPDTGAPRVITGGALNTTNCSYMQISKIGNL
jgi:hypothetical protein